MIQLYTGEGKGKTTAAVGQAVRAAGSGYQVIFSQFMKGNDSGELHSLSQVTGVEIIRSEKEFGFYSTLSREEKEELTEIHNRILDRLLLAAKTEQVFLIVLDEITYPVKWGLVDIKKVRELLSYGKPDAKGPESVEILLTGRDAADFLKASADYITEMRCVRHPYEQGIRARKGIEY